MNSKRINALRTWFGAASICFLFSYSSVNAEDASTPIERSLHSLVKPNDSIALLGADAFGDSVSLYNGAVSFSQLDASIPGNSGLAVEVTRKFGSYGEMASMPTSHGHFGDWELDLPSVSGTFSRSKGWLVGAQESTSRCSQFGQPSAVSADLGGALFLPN